MESTWSCDSVRKYQILVSYHDERKALVTHVAGRSNKQFHITHLDPDTEYCISIKFQNNGGFFSPPSPEKCVKTPATGMPLIISLFSFLLRTHTILENIHKTKNINRMIENSNTELSQILYGTSQWSVWRWFHCNAFSQNKRSIR